MSALNNPQFEAFLEAVTTGVSVDDAALIADLPSATISKSLDAGRDEADRVARGSRPRKTYASQLELWNAYRKARAKGRSRLLSQIQSHGADDWKAVAAALAYLDKNEVSDRREDPAYYMGGSK